MRKCEEEENKFLHGFIETSTYSYTLHVVPVLCTVIPGCVCKESRWDSAQPAFTLVGTVTQGFIKYLTLRRAVETNKMQWSLLYPYSTTSQP